MSSYKQLVDTSVWIALFERGSRKKTGDNFCFYKSFDRTLSLLLQNSQNQTNVVART